MTEIETELTEEVTTEFETVTCARCGCTSTLPQYFQKSWNKKHNCPACAIKNDVRNNKILFALLGIYLIVDLVIDGARFGWLSWQAWSVVGLIVVTVFSLVSHELSHALAAKLLGGRVFGIQFGIGRQLLRRWFNDFFLGIGMLPVSGVCFAGFPTNKLLRVRYAIYISAGLLFHGVILLVAIRLFRAGSSLPFLMTLIVINGLLFFFNALPLNVTTAVGPTGSDGMLLWRLATGKLARRDLKANYYRMAASFAYQQENIEQLKRYIQEGLLLDPSDEFLENLRVYLLLNEEDRLEEAYIAWKLIVESERSETAEPLHQAIFYNNYAWATMMHRPEADSLQVARDYAEKAYQMTPWIQVIKGTLAAVMVEQGEHLKGAEWALEVAKVVEDEVSPARDKNIAANLATAALGYFRMGGRETAVQYLSQAKALTSDDRTVKKAIAEIEKDINDGL